MKVWTWRDIGEYIQKNINPNYLDAEAMADDGIDFRRLAILENVSEETMGESFPYFILEDDYN